MKPKSNLINSFFQQTTSKPEPKKERNLDRHKSDIMLKRIYWNEEDIRVLYADTNKKEFLDRLNILIDKDIKDEMVAKGIKYIDVSKMCQRDLIYLTIDELVNIRKIFREEQEFLINYKKEIKTSKLTSRFYNNIEFVKSMLESIDRLYEELDVRPKEDLSTTIGKWATVAMGVVSLIGVSILTYNECREILTDEL